MGFARVLQQFLRRRSMLLTKYPSEPFDALPVFRLAVEHLMRLRGDALSFIQVGANDGRFVDPLRRYVVDRGWRGILIEPQPDVFERLEANYAEQADRLVFVNAAVAEGGKPLFMYRPPNDGANERTSAVYQLSVVSANPDVVAKQTGFPKAQLERIEVPSVTLDALIEEHGYQQCDLLQIDTEGFEWTVLQTISLDRYRPALIQFEHGHLTPEQGSAIAKRLADHGYRLFWGGYQGDSVAMLGELFD